MEHKNPSSRVIDSLHQQIDVLKNDVETHRSSSEDYKKKYTLAAKKNDSIVDQLANTKHENDMINALLKRKERRIADLEEQFNEMAATNESLQMNNKNLRIRCDNLQELSASLTAEYERLRIAYDALVASQAAYKTHYQEEVNRLLQEFARYRTENEQRLDSLAAQVSHNDKDVDTLLDLLTNKRRTMDNLYVSKNRAVLTLVTKLAHTALAHGEEAKGTIQALLDTVRALVEKHPDLAEKVTQYRPAEVDIDALLAEGMDALSCSFEEEEDTSNNTANAPAPTTNGSHSRTPSISRSNTMQSKRRKNKRNSIRFDKAPDSNSTPPTPTQTTLPKRPNLPSGGGNRNSWMEKPRTPTPPTELFEQFQKQNFVQNFQNANHFQNLNHFQNQYPNQTFQGQYANQYANQTPFPNQGQFQNLVQMYGQGFGQNFGQYGQLANQYQYQQGFNQFSGRARNTSGSQKKANRKSYNKRNSQIEGLNVSF